MRYFHPNGKEVSLLEAIGLLYVGEYIIRVAEPGPELWDALGRQSVEDAIGELKLRGFDYQLLTEAESLDADHQEMLAREEGAVVQAETGVRAGEPAKGGLFGTNPTRRKGPHDRFPPPSRPTR